MEPNYTPSEDRNKLEQFVRNQLNGLTPGQQPELWQRIAAEQQKLNPWMRLPFCQNHRHSCRSGDLAEHRGVVDGGIQPSGSVECHHRTGTVNNHTCDRHHRKHRFTVGNNPTKPKNQKI